MCRRVASVSQTNNSNSPLITFSVRTPNFIGGSPSALSYPQRNVKLHRRIIAQSGGAPGVLNLSALESALAQPQMTFGGNDLYPTLVEKAAALGYSLIQNHPFVDGTNASGTQQWKFLLS